MQVAVRLRRETGMDGHALELSAGGDILFNKSMDEVPALSRSLLRIFDLFCHWLCPPNAYYFTWSYIIQNPIKNCKQNQSLSKSHNFLVSGKFSQFFPKSLANFLRKHYNYIPHELGI